MGDFNLTFEQELDRLNTTHNNDKSKEVLLQIMEEYMLQDIWRTRHELEKQYSWYKIDHADPSKLKASRIDLCLTSPMVTQNTYDTFYINGEDTDHRALVLVLQINDNERGPGYWKFNSSLLLENEFVEYMSEELIKEIRSVKNKSETEGWEIIKKRVKTVTNRYARNRAREKELIISQLSERIVDMEGRLPLVQQDYAILENSKRELTQLLDEKTQGCIFRSKTKWMSEGDRSSKYFFNLEKNRYVNKTCAQIFDDQDNIITESSQILEIQRQFYADLYTENREVEFTIKNEDSPKLDSSGENVDKQLEIAEFDIAVTEMSANKSPGKDGITVEFYRHFWHLLREPMYKAFIKSYDIGILFKSAREGVLNLIPKSNKDTRRVKNLRANYVIEC